MEIVMRYQLLTAATFAMMAVGATSNATQAAPLGFNVSPTVQNQSIATPVNYRNYCGRWSGECRARWGLSWRYGRCMRLHGC